MVNVLYVNAGKRIKELRLLKEYSRGEFAEKTNLSDKFIYEIETGKKGFTAEVLYRIANVLDVSCDYILSGNAAEEPSYGYIDKIIGDYNDEQKKTVLKILELIKEL